MANKGMKPSGNGGRPKTEHKVVDAISAGLSQSFFRQIEDADRKHRPMCSKP